MEATAASPTQAYPARLDIDYPEELNRLLPLVKWLLLIPHYFALFILYFAAMFAAIAGAFAVLFTGYYPPALFGFQLGVMRWWFRVTAYMYLMTDRYPPFSLVEEPDDPVRVEIEYPEDGVERWRPFVAWLLAIPYLIAAAVIGYIAQILVFFAFFAILFTKRFPRGMFDIVLVSQRWYLRGYAYALFMVKRYPPFVWD
jgi:ABC-type multidrug transport system fused ATPase/permease subunit